MGLSYGFFDAELDALGEYDRAYTAEQFAEYFGLIVSNGVFPNPSTQLQVVANTTPDMSVKVDEGYGWINGYFAKNDGPYTLSIQTASGSLKRIDAIVLRWVKETRSMEFAVKEGTLSSSPVAPPPTRDDSLYELILAHIAIPAGATKITQSMITDTRTDASLCGIVTGAVQNIDATTLFAQYNAAFQEWFDNLKAQLGGNVAANLQAQIDERVKISDKATLEDAKSGLNDSRWMTPRLTKEMVDAVAYGIGDIKESARNLELLSDGKYVLCDGRALVSSAYPELDSALNGRYGYFPSIEELTTVHSQIRSDKPSILGPAIKSSDGVITAVSSAASSSAWKVTRLSESGSVVGSYALPSNQSIIALFRCGANCYILANDTSEDIVYLHLITNSENTPIWSLDTNANGSFLGSYVSGSTVYAVFVYRTTSAGKAVIGVLKVTGDSVAFSTIPTEIAYASLYGFVLGDTLYFNEFQTKLEEISVVSISEPEAVKFIQALTTQGNEQSLMGAPQAFSEDGLLCGTVYGTSAGTNVKTIEKMDETLVYREYPVRKYTGTQSGENIEISLTSSYAQLAFIGKTPWLAIRTLTTSGGAYFGKVVEGIVVLDHYISGYTFQFFTGGGPSYYGEEGPLVVLTSSNSTTSGNYTYTDRNLAKFTYNGRGFFIPDLVSSVSGGPSGLPVSYIKAKP